MNDGFPRGQSAIVGAATYGIGEAPGLESIDLAAHASLKALKQANLTPADVEDALRKQNIEPVFKNWEPTYNGPSKEQSSATTHPLATEPCH